MGNTALDYLGSLSKAEEFYLMNKNEVLAKFVATSINNKLVFTLDMTSIRRLPPKFISLDKFLDSRTVITQRSEVLACLSTLGLKSKFDILLANYGVSLSDTLWVKRVSDTITWEIVSPYRKDRVFDISWFLTDSAARIVGEGLYRPEYSTDGTFPKCWVSESGIHTLLKCGTSGAYNTGLEPFSELYANQVEKVLCKANSFTNYSIKTVDYSNVSSKYKMSKFLQQEYDGFIDEHYRFASACNSFCTEDIGLVSAAELGLNTYKEVEKYISENLPECESKKFAELLLLDCIIVNVDRHLGNIGFLYDNNTFEILGLAPVFDNNMSLCCYWVKSLDGSAIEYADSCYSKLGIRFDILGKEVLMKYPEFADELNQISQYFEFEQRSVHNFKRSRLSDLSSVVRNQANRILK